MKRIKLTQGKYALVDDADFEWLSKWKWYYHTDGASSKGYAQRSQYDKLSKNDKVVHMHRLINDTPDGLFTDHINKNKLDNRRSNLRTVTKQQNCTNRCLNKNNTSGFRGVYWEKDKSNWAVQIGVNFKRKKIGRFKNLQDAIQARKKAELIYHQI